MPILAVIVIVCRLANVLHPLRSTAPIEYLGYQLIPSSEYHASQWDIHNDMIYEKFAKTCDKLLKSKFRPLEMIKIINSNLATVTLYFFYCNHMPIDSSHDRRIHNSLSDDTLDLQDNFTGDDFPEDAFANKTRITTFENKLFRLIQQRWRRVMNRTPRAILWNKSSGMGLDLTNLKVLYYTAKIVNLLSSLQSHSKYLRTTMWETVLELERDLKWNPLDGTKPFPYSSYSYNKMGEFPHFIRDACLGLKYINCEIKMNYSHIPIQKCSLAQFLSDTKRKTFNDGKTNLEFLNKLPMEDILPCLKDHTSIGYQTIKGYLTKDKNNPYNNWLGLCATVSGSLQLLY